MKELTQYIEVLKKEYKSENTIVSYSKIIEKFMKFIEKNIFLVTEYDINNYKVHLSERKLKATTINTYLIVIRDFLSFFDIKVTPNLVSIQKKFILDNLISDKEIQKIVRKAQLEDDSRTAAIVYGCYSTGMRVSECLGVPESAWLDFKSKTLEVHGKGNKKRKVLYPGGLKTLIRKYYKNRTGKGNEFFKGKKGNIGRRTALANFKKYGADIGIDREKLYLHNLRHRFAVNFLEKNRDVYALSKILGHTNLKTVEIYLMKTTNEYLDDIESMITKI